MLFRHHVADLLSLSRKEPAKAPFNEHWHGPLEGPCLSAFMVFFMSVALVFDLGQGQNHSLLRLHICCNFLIESQFLMFKGK